MAENSRQIAFEILNKIETDDSFSNIMLNNYLKKIESSVDKAFISRLVYGVVERKLTLDYIIGKFCKKYTSSKKVVKTALRMGVYQIYPKERQLMKLSIYLTTKSILTIKVL